VVHARLRPGRALGVERGGLASQARGPRLRGRHGRSPHGRRERAGVRDRDRAAGRVPAPPADPARPHDDAGRGGSALVRLVRLQRRQRPRERAARCARVHDDAPRRRGRRARLARGRVVAPRPGSSPAALPSRSASWPRSSATGPSC
jgi:hypothetical protein